MERRREKLDNFELDRAFATVIVRFVELLLSQSRKPQHRLIQTKLSRLLHDMLFHVVGSTIRSG
jgi:hypothetical protein